MRVRVAKEVETDRLILVSRDPFMTLVDHKNLACRDSEIISNQYHKDWFYELEQNRYFKAPIIQIHSGNITFINGRHRTIVMARMLEAFPMAVGNIDIDHVGGTKTKASLCVYDMIRKEELLEHSSFELPDLPYGDFKKA